MAAAPFVRRNAHALTDDTLKWYAKAVTRMQTQLPADDPRNWSNQAAMHGSDSKPDTWPFNQCQHASWYFVGWHRLYVYWFEQIVRAQVAALGGPADWTLPYWNYSDPATRSIPPEFIQPNDPDFAALYVADRNPAVNQGAQLDPASVDVTKALGQTVFNTAVGVPGISSFGGQDIPSPMQFNDYSGTGALEQTPHNDVHVAVGGWMGDPMTAAQDPIFWLHHANIDRLWASWNALGNKDTTDPDWEGQSFGFYDADGTPASLPEGQIEDTEAMPVPYTYDAFEPLLAAREDRPEAPPPARSRIELVGASAQPVRLTGERVTHTVTIDRASRDAVLTATAGGEPEHVYLTLEDISAGERLPVPYRVYVNLPDDASADESLDHLAGTLSLFGIQRAQVPAGDAHAHPFKVHLEITALYRRLAAREQWDPDQVRVTLLPTEFRPAEGAPAGSFEAVPEHDPVTVGRVSVQFA